MNRRKFLGGLAAAPIVGQEAIANVASKINLSPAPHILGDGGGFGGKAFDAPMEAGKRVTLKTFADLLMRKEDDWRRQAKYVPAIDPDILSLRLPLATMIRMQRERNFARIKSEEERDFLGIIKRNGQYEWWE